MNGQKIKGEKNGRRSAESSKQKILLLSQVVRQHALNVSCPGSNPGVAENADKQYEKKKRILYSSKTKRKSL